MEINVDIRLTKSTQKFLAETQKAIYSALELIGVFVEGEAKLRCPVDTGRLRQSIIRQVNEPDESVRIGTPVEYGPYVEFGTIKMKAQPFLRPAVLDNKKDIARLIASALRADISEVKIL